MSVNNDPAEQVKTCTQCGKPLYGRSDKIFCDDNCRNTFNRHKREYQRSLDHSNMPEIFRIIKRNYEILKSITVGEALEINTRIQIPAEELIKKGLNIKFYTSSYTDDQGTWKFCFERGWLMDMEDFQIRDRPEQARVK